MWGEGEAGGGAIQPCHVLSLIYTLTLYYFRRTWGFKPSHPQRIISGLKETRIKRYVAERTTKAEIRLKEQSEKAESCRENLWNEIQLKGP